MSVSLGDIDGDGDLDAFVANFNEPNRVWLNDPPDSDSDGIPDHLDGTPLDDDTDDDGLLDGEDPDIDGDGLSNDDETTAGTDAFEIDKDIEAKLLITVAPDGYLKRVKD